MRKRRSLSKSKRNFSSHLRLSYLLLKVRGPSLATAADDILTLRGHPAVPSPTNSPRICQCEAHRSSSVAMQ
ncbi:unnamed protein product [Nezara viridula]|uniref:Uncharacterized protein n=1 Tax=Nezara viridula TaxID=85310 RepID=A0A9P0H8G0_NEZVI|nr:unnamed protein product [Nezara viridula]